MGLISGILSFALCAFVYVRMVKREVPEPMATKNAVIPAVVGLAAPLLSVLVVIALGYTVIGIWGKPVRELISSMVLRSVVASFLGAGFTEEFVKCLLILLMVKLLKPKNVYEYILIGAGIGFGFTLSEEISYGAAGGFAIMLMRMISFAMHLLWGMIMASYFGRARYNKENGLGGSGKLIFLGCIIPVVWHTLFDSVSANNAGFAMEDPSDMVLLVSFLSAVVVLLVSDILQFVILVKFKKKAEVYSEMVFAQ